MRQAILNEYDFCRIKGIIISCMISRQKSFNQPFQGGACDLVSRMLQRILPNVSRLLIINLRNMKLSFFDGALPITTPVIVYIVIYFDILYVSCTNIFQISRGNDKSFNIISKFSHIYLCEH